MALRVPKAELPAELRENLIKQLGSVPEPNEVLWNNPELAEANQEFSAKVGTWDAVDASLKTFAHMPSRHRSAAPGASTSTTSRH